MLLQSPLSHTTALPPLPPAPDPDSVATLETFIEEEPDDIATIARSVTADTLLHQRQVVLQRLRQMGVDVIEAPYTQIGYELIDRYFMIKNSEAIG